MSVPDSSLATTGPDPRKPGPRQSSAGRKNRRVFVENLMIDGHRDGRIAVDIAKRFGISTRMVRKDLRLIRLRWAREDNDYLAEQRKRQVKALERIARRAESASDLAQARMARRDIAHLLGMGTAFTMQMTGTVTVEHRPTNPREWNEEFLRAALEAGLVLPGMPTVVTVPKEDAHVA